MHLALPTFNEELALWKQGFTHVVGVDEVGRGAFAGPIVAAAVIFSPGVELHPPTFLLEVTDSKLLTKQKREQLAPLIMKHALAYAIELVDIDYINKHGIGKANQEAMRACVSRISEFVFRQPIYDIPNTKYHILVDGFRIAGLDLPQKALIKGDQKSYSIAAASIIAKVHRDRLMATLHEEYPVYGFAKNMGYGTLSHRQAITEYGLCNAHRTSFNLTPYIRPIA